MANELDDKLDEKLAGALALALSRYPRANLQQLARVAGTSKGTLYRICSTREGLIELLVARGERHMRASLEQADLTQPLFAQALQRLTEHLISGAALYMFWSTARWVNIGDIKESEPQGYTPSFFNQALEEFFLRGQKAGIFRIDMPARWLAKSYDFLLYAAIESAQLGEIATLGMSTMVVQMFLHGASTEMTPTSSGPLTMDSGGR